MNRIIYKIKDWYGGIKRRHHIIKTHLPISAWWDADVRILYGMMSVLDRFYNEEFCRDIVDWDADKEHRQAKQEIIEIKKWWDNYPNLQKEIDKSLDDWHEQYCIDADGKEENRLLEKHNLLEEQLIKEEQEMLHRLVEIRRFLWT